MSATPFSEDSTDQSANSHEEFDVTTGSNQAADESSAEGHRDLDSGDAASEDVDGDVEVEVPNEVERTPTKKKKKAASSEAAARKKPAAASAEGETAPSSKSKVAKEATEGEVESASGKNQPAAAKSDPVEVTEKTSPETKKKAVVTKKKAAAKPKKAVVKAATPAPKAKKSAAELEPVAKPEDLDESEDADDFDDSYAADLQAADAAAQAEAEAVAAEAKELKKLKKPAVKVSAPLKASAPTKTKRPGLVEPPPPAPKKPPFVPPKAPVAYGVDASAEKGSPLSPEFIEIQRQRLLDLRDELVDTMSGMTRDSIRNAPEGSDASGSGMHQGDAGSDAYDRDFALSVLEKDQDAIYEIEQALQRIRKGTYGICEISSRVIPQMRLEARPFARLTVDCQAQWEKENGNRRYRSNQEVGFSGGIQADGEDSDSNRLDEDED